MKDRPCEICGAKTSFERKDISQPREGEVCSLCEKWVCPNCVDHKKCLQPPNNYDVVCNECSKNKP